MATSQRESPLALHTFPPFYACYLLKSIQTAQSQKTYIGSTPHPPRRIRQHNGELTQGARKTAGGRPWVMQMLVHGFPSRQAALQFEWAWQHPHVARHLRPKDGSKAVFKRRIGFKPQIQVLLAMVSSHPFNTWPLHIKLFTEEAAATFAALTNPKNAVNKLPKGLMVSIELEGVDGLSKHVGSGRKGPIDVSDATFTTNYLRKHHALVASQSPLACSICHETLNNYPADSLITTLCTTSGCSDVSHLVCLSKHFLAIEAQDTGHTSMIPRGGNCKGCQQFVLWGDLIRGCYRREKGG
ncbi:hypothetical protein FIBSPDRAFT_740815, partial [Athelia psychrophila]